MKYNLLVIAVMSISLDGRTAHAQTPESKGEDTAPPSSAKSDADEETTPTHDRTQSSSVGHSAEDVEAVDPVDLERLIDTALKRLSKEPSLEQLGHAALIYADAHPESSRRWARASRASAVLPTLKTTADMDLGRDEALDRYQDRPDRWSADTGRGYGFQVSAQWNLDELVFNPDELRVYDALTDLAERREELLSTLVGYYYERRRLQLESMLVPAADLKEALDRRVRINELTAFIDALTGGMLSAKLSSGASNKP